MKIVLVLLSLAFSSQAFAKYTEFLGEQIKSVRSPVLAELYNQLYSIDSDIYFGEIVDKDQCAGDPTLTVKLLSLEKVRQNQNLAFHYDSYAASAYPGSYVSAKFAVLKDLHGVESLKGLSAFLGRNIEGKFSSTGSLRLYEVMDNVNDPYLPRVVNQAWHITILILDVKTSEVMEVSNTRGGTADCD